MLVFPKTSLQHFISACFLIFLCVLKPAIAQVAVTDTFESGVFSASWVSTTGTVVTTGSGAVGSTKFANLAASNSALGARLDGVQAGGMANFTIDQYVRVQATTGRKFQFQISTSSAAISTVASAFNLRYQNGEWALYDGSVWIKVFGLNVLSDNVWHRVRITGRNWGQASAHCDIEVSSPGRTEFTSSAAALKVFQTTTPLSSLARYFVYTATYDSCPGFAVDAVNASSGAPTALPLQLDVAELGTVHLSDGSSVTAALSPALDSNPSTLSVSSNTPGSFWELELTRQVPVTRVQVVAPSTLAYSGALNGLVMRVYSMRDQLVHEQTISGVAIAGIWTLDLPANVNGRIFRLSLPPGVNNGMGDQRIALAEFKVFSPAYSVSGTNYALNMPSYMVRLSDSLPPSSYANDGNLATTMETTDKSVDGYWETDLGQARALHHVRVIGLDSAAEQARLAHATVRLYDENHNSIYSKHLSGLSSTFDVILPGPLLVRYVRVGFEYKERSHATGGIEWFLRIREVEAYGRPASDVGIASFAASASSISSGTSTTLSWQVDGLYDLMLYPNIGSVGASTAVSGAGQITVSPTTTTEYTLVGTSATETFIRHVTVQVDGQPATPTIQEVGASNRLAFRDGFKDAPDWVELHNPNATPLNIAGYCLSDTLTNLAKWAFPTGAVIPANGSIVVCASGRGLAVPDEAGYYHTNFSLAAGGESVLLATPGGSTVLDSVTFPAQEEDVSYGRVVAGPWSFMEPSPGTMNLSETYEGWLLPVTFSHSRGFYSSAISLSLTNPNPDSQLLYSLDGTEPSLLYTGPIAISQSRSVRARVVRAGYHAPRTQTHSYLFSAATPTALNMNTGYASGNYLTRQIQGFSDLPTLSLSLPELPDDYVETEGSVEIFLPGNPVPIQVNCGMERFGGAWTEFTKKSYRLNFSADFGARKLEAPLFNGFDKGMPVKEVFDSIELRAGNHDMVDRGFYMGSRFIEDSMLEMGSLNPHGRFVHVYINGNYWGMYDARERMVDAFLAEYLGGQKEDYVNVRGNDNLGDNFIPGTPEPPNRELWEYVRANRSSYAAIKDKVDVSHLIDFMLVWFYGNTESEYRCAGPIAAGTGFKFWLADPDGMLRTSALNLNRTSNSGPGGIFGALVAEGHPDFKILLADRIQKHFFNNGAMTPTRTLARMNARMTEVQNAMVSECARWGFRTPENWVTAADAIRTGLFPQRTGTLFTMMRNQGLFPTLDAPVFSQHGGSVNQGYPVTFSPVTGTVVFTLDGSDPRLPGGAISPTALTWTNSGQTLVPLNSTWKYWDLGSLPAANWNTLAYNDAAWVSGAAPLGYGNGDEATVISYGPSSSNKYRTSYFRKTLTVANPAQFSQLTLGVVRDDGAVVYINGVEVARSNMPLGAITYDTTAASSANDAAEYQLFTFSIPSSALVIGQNLVAVEIHQHSGTSSDVRFDLSLTGAASTSATTIQGNKTIKARVLNGSTWSALSEATFQVAYPLVSSGPYLLNEWSSTATATTYPPHMTFYQTSAAIADPGIDVDMSSPWILPYNRSSRSRINGLATDGFAFINTSDPQNEPGSGYVGAAVLAINATGAQDIRVTWTGGTVAPNIREYAVRLQYRVGDTGSFQNVLDGLGNPVEYIRNAVAGHSQVIGPVTLPADANNQNLVQLRWKYYFRSGTSSARAQLRVDNIQVSAGHPAASLLEISQAPLAGQVGRTLPPVEVTVKSATGALATGYQGPITLSLAGNPTALSGTTTRNAVNGLVTFDDLSIHTPGLFTITATAADLSSAQADNATRVAGLSSVLVPQYMQGKVTTNDERVPFAYYLALSGLRQNATYRYANRMVSSSDAPTQDGAGNMIFVRQGGLPFIRTTSGPSFLAADLHIGHGEFTTSGTGEFSGWFITEPTGNTRFTPGASVYPRLLLNDGEGGTEIFHYLSVSDAVEVLPFGSAPIHGSALFGASDSGAQNFVVLYADEAGATRPLAATPVEATGATLDASYADFYKNSVAGQGGRWGTIIPNNLTNGVRRLEARDRTSGALVSSFTSPDGLPATGNADFGTNSRSVLFPGPTAHGFTRWQARHFALNDLQPGGPGTAHATPASDGMTNLMKYAFGLKPLERGSSAMPVSQIIQVSGQKRLQYQFRRLTGQHGLNYQIQISNTLGAWSNAESSLLPGETILSSPTPDTETVMRQLPITPGIPERFLRLHIELPE